MKNGTDYVVLPGTYGKTKKVPKGFKLKVSQWIKFWKKRKNGSKYTVSTYGWPETTSKHSVSPYGWPETTSKHSVSIYEWPETTSKHTVPTYGWLDTTSKHEESTQDRTDKRPMTWEERRRSYSPTTEQWVKETPTLWIKNHKTKKTTEEHPFVYTTTDGLTAQTYEG